MTSAGTSRSRRTWAHSVGLLVFTDVEGGQINVETRLGVVELAGLRRDALGFVAALEHARAHIDRHPATGLSRCAH